MPKTRAIKIIREGGEELRKFIPINNSQKGKIYIQLSNLEDIKSYFLQLVPKASISISLSIAKRQIDIPIKIWKLLSNEMVIRNEVPKIAIKGLNNLIFIFNF